MTSFSEQLSAVRQSQWETQLELFRRLSSHALENTEQLIALNMRTSRASMEQAAGTVKKLLEASEPRDLLTVGSNAQGQWHQMFAYGRELLGIATGVRGSWTTMPTALSFMPSLPALTAPPVVPVAPVVPAALRLIPPPAADLPASPSQAAEQVAIAAADASTVASEIAAAASDIGEALLESTLDTDAGIAPSSEAVTKTLDASPETPAQAAEAAAEPANELAAGPATESTGDSATEPAAAAVEPVSPAEAALAFAEAASDTAIADEVPPGETTLLAKALNEIAPKPASVEHPIVSTVPLEVAAAAIELPTVAPIDHTAPPVQLAQPGKPPRVVRKK